MARKSSKYGIYEVDHTKFGGKIDIEDFNTNFPNKKRIRNQIDAINLKNILNKELVNRKEMQKYKNMTFEELKRLKLISNTNGRPSSTLTDKKWQTEFELRRMFIQPYDENVKTLTSKYSIESDRWNGEVNGIYPGKTNWQEYCSYINDVLNTIRSNQVDYCYYIYQIEQLLRFHHRNLRTQYCDGYWKVWLER